MGSIANRIANLSHVVGMPDEPSWGQARRLLRENGIYDLRALVGTLKCEICPKALRSSWFRAMFCHLLAGGAETPERRSYFTHHCMLPQLTSSRYYGWRWEYGAEDFMHGTPHGVSSVQ
ncbi:MAG: hypothetical protein ACK5US_13420 [Lysobacteraceae bacterium]